MKPPSVVILLSALLVLVPAAPASAHISSFDFQATNITCTDETCNQADYNRARGTITCDAGERFLIVAKVVDSPSYEGKGWTKGTCTGSPQQWGADLTVESGFGDLSCPSRYVARARTKVDGVRHDTATDIDAC